MRKYVLIFSLIFALTLPAYAQDTPASSDCPAAADALPVLAEFLTELADEPMAALDVIYEAVVEARAKCAGLVFSSDEYGLQPVIGPVEIPEGLYRVTVNTTGFFIGEVTPLDGDCGARGFGALFALSAGQAENAQALLESSGCSTLLEISNTREPWTLTFEKLR